MKRFFGLLLTGAVLAGIPAASLHAQDTSIPNLAGKVLTVQGPIDPSALGVTLMHEHIFIDFKAPPPMIPAPVGISVLSDPTTLPVPPGSQARASFGLIDFDESLAEVQEFRRIGGGTIVDVTNFGLTRDPEALLRVSRASGLNVIMGAGWYQKALHPPDMSERTVDELTDIVVRDVTVGAQGTNIRSGIIGEVGINARPLGENEMKSARASGRASRLTGAPIMVHSFGTPDEMLRVLDILESEGVPLNRVTMGHTGSRNLDYMRQLFARGVFVEWDYMGQAPLPPKQDTLRIESIYAAIEAGFAKQIVLAHDVCTQAQLRKNNGGGYTYIHDIILPGLRAKGVSDAVLRQIMVENPMKALTFGAPQEALTR